jgi:hypothetical protein
MAQQTHGISGTLPHQHDAIGREGKTRARPLTQRWCRAAHDSPNHRNSDMLNRLVYGRSARTRRRGYSGFAKQAQHPRSFPLSRGSAEARENTVRE